MTSLEESDTKKVESIFTKEQDNFLNHKHKVKFLTEFKVGKNEVVIYGNLILAAKKSSVLTEMTDRFADSEPPYHLMTTIEVEERALQVVWLSLHGFSDLHIPVSRLNLIEILSMADIMWYFDMCKYHSTDSPYGPWWDYFGRVIRCTSRSDLLINKERITEVINKLMKQDSSILITHYSYIVKSLSSSGLDEIAANLNFVVIGREDVFGHQHYDRLVDRKAYDKTDDKRDLFLYSGNESLKAYYKDWQLFPEAYEVMYSKAMMILRKIPAKPNILPASKVKRTVYWDWKR